LQSQATWADTTGVNANVGAGVNAQTGTTAGGNTTTGVQTDTSGVSAGGNVSTGINGSLSDKSTLSDVMATLTASQDASASIDISKINVKHIKFIRVSKLSGYTSASFKLDDTEKSNMTKLDASVAANAELTAALKRHGYRPSDVVAISSDAKGDVKVFIAK
jgi:hypothetical protein